MSNKFNKDDNNFDNPIQRAETMEHVVLTLNRLVERVEGLECKLKDTEIPAL